MENQSYVSAQQAVDNKLNYFAIRDKLIYLQESILSIAKSMPDTNSAAYQKLMALATEPFCPPFVEDSYTVSDLRLRFKQSQKVNALSLRKL